MLRDLNAKVEGKISKLKVLLAMKDENLKSVAIKLGELKKPCLLVQGLFLLNLICLMIHLKFLLKNLL